MELSHLWNTNCFYKYLTVYGPRGAYFALPLKQSGFLCNFPILPSLLLPEKVQLQKSEDKRTALVAGM